MKKLLAMYCFTCNLGLLLGPHRFANALEGKWKSVLFRLQMPREGLRREGVLPGQLLFNDEKTGSWYSGFSRVFSRQCHGAPLEYFVEGPVLQNPLRIEVSGGSSSSQKLSADGRMHTRLVGVRIYWSMLRYA